MTDETRAFARTLRSTQTTAEDMLWRDLRGRRLDGTKWRRQVPVGRYVADFLCCEGRLIVELDGAPHADAARVRHDRERDAWLRGQGFQVLRFSNDLMIGGSGELVLRVIRVALRGHPSSDPC